MDKNTQQDKNSKKKPEELAPFKDRDVVKPEDVMIRFHVCYNKATELIAQWKLLLKAVGRDVLDMAATITKDDYAYIIGIDVDKLY